MFVYRLKEWKKLPDSDCLDQVELLMRRKAMAVSDFPQEAVSFKCIPVIMSPMGKELLQHI